MIRERSAKRIGMLIFFSPGIAGNPSFFLLGS
jgi:hypothetical protein